MKSDDVDRGIEFIDLQAQRRRLGRKVDDAIAQVLGHGRFILGPEVSQFENELGEFVGAQHVVGCANGTDAIVLALQALGIGRGDAVVVPSFTFCATAEAVAIVGATPVFAEISLDTFNLDPASCSAAFSVAEGLGLHARAVIAVDLFGLSADHRALGQIATDRGAWLVDDAAQAIGAQTPWGRVGSLAAIATTSFFPAKPLGCYGDGGAVLTQDAEIAARLRSLRVHGKGTNKYDNVVVGQNSRLDTVQAAVLLEKLSIFEDEIERRQVVAGRYGDALGEYVVTPSVPDGFTSTWAQYTVLTDPKRRDEIALRLRQNGVPTAIYYPKPLHQQTAYRDYPRVADLARSEEASQRALSLPMHPYLGESVQQEVIDAVVEAVTS